MTYNLFDKFLVKAGLDMSFGRYAKGYEAGEHVSEINNQFAYNMGCIPGANETHDIWSG